MAVFIATVVAENFPGTVATDAVRYEVNATEGVTVNVIAGGSAGIATGDTYTSIERFFLSNLAGETDRFFGSGADELVRGFAGFNVLNGLGGDDTLIGGGDGNRLIGGEGMDTVLGGGGNDVFVVAAGDGEAGEVYNGFGGTDTLLLLAGGTGTEADLSGATILSVERLVYNTDITVVLTDAQLDALNVIASAASGEVIRVSDWSSLDESADIDEAIELLQNGVDAVEWEHGPDLGTATIVAQTIPGGTEEEYVATFVNDGPTNIEIDTLEVFFNAAGQMTDSVQTDDDGLVTNTTFDPATGAKLTETVFDLSPGGALEPWTLLFTEFDANGDPLYSLTEFDDGVDLEQIYIDGELVVETYTEVTATGFTETSFDMSLDGSFAPYTFLFTEYDTNGDKVYELFQGDDGVDREDIYIDGDLAFVTFTDNSDGGLAEDYETVQQIISGTGAGAFVSYELTTFDAGGPFVEEELIFSAPGVLEQSTLVRSNGVEIVTGSAVDQTFTASDATEVFRGQGGIDTFEFSGDVGNNVITDFDDNGADLLDLTSYGIESRTDLENAGALTYDAINQRFIIDVAQIGGDGRIVLNGMADGDLGNDDFVLLLA